MAEVSICRVDGCVNVAELDDLPLCGAHLNALTDGVATVKIALSSCVVEGCKGKPKNRFLPYCQMHDARLRRHGNLEMKPIPEALIHSHGYRLVLAEGHPMARGVRGYEHRVVYYDAHPDGPLPCHWCSNPLTWATAQIDHLNTIRDDNRLDNLVAACGGCNRDRAKPAAALAARRRAKGYMVNGRWLSVVDAAKALGIEPSSITTRLKKGWPVERALTEPRGRFGPKKEAA